MPMTEKSWLRGDNPGSLLRHLKPQASNRKLHLFAAACVERARTYLPEVVRVALAAVEQFLEQRGAARQTLAKAITEIETLVLQARDSSSELSLSVAQTRLAAVRLLSVPASGSTWRLVRDVALALPEAVCHDARWERVPISQRAETAERLRAEEKAYQADLFRDIFVNPFRPLTIDPAWLEWRDRTVPRLAEGIYCERAFEGLPVLADALEDAGCHDEEILGHCRAPAVHVRGCWLLDALTGRQ
jgi:hypothetical protein